MGVFRYSNPHSWRDDNNDKEDVLWEINKTITKVYDGWSDFGDGNNTALQAIQEKIREKYL